MQASQKGAADAAPYNIAANGRMALTSGSGPIFWFIDTNRAVATERASSGLIIFEPQNTTATCNTPLPLVTTAPIINTDTAVGAITFTTAGAASYIQDISGLNATLSSNQSVSTTYAEAGSGRIVLPATGAPKLLVYPSTNGLFVLDLDTSNPKPTITIVR